MKMWRYTECLYQGWLWTLKTSFQSYTTNCSTVTIFLCGENFTLQILLCNLQLLNYFAMLFLWVLLSHEKNSNCVFIKLPLVKTLVALGYAMRSRAKSSSCICIMSTISQTPSNISSTNTPFVGSFSRVSTSSWADIFLPTLLMMSFHNGFLPVPLVLTHRRDMGLHTAVGIEST